MKINTNISPVGWYVGTYVLRFVEIAEQRKNNPRQKFLTWENTVIVKASNLDRAYDKVVKIAKQNTKPFKAGPSPGVAAQWIFEGLIELLPIYEKIEDGAEIIWAERAPKTLKNIRAQVRRKKQFYQ